jgi:hypothetical protein
VRESWILCWRCNNKPLRRVAVQLAVTALIAISNLAATTNAIGASLNDVPILQRHVALGRDAAAENPHSESDQAIVDGWPLYRTERGQEAFNQAMATLQATAGASPRESYFRGCADLLCQLRLPNITASGWLPSGRLWLSPREYILFVRSPRRQGQSGYRRRPKNQMRVFVFHEFRNSTTNTDIYDTISAHHGTVFTPFYLSKPQRDSVGRTFVTLVQVAPYDVDSNHAANHGSRGPGIEVAKNSGEPLSAIQSKAGIMIATIVKKVEPQLRLVHHHRTEGLAMLRAYRQWRGSLRNRVIRLPFQLATPTELASATGRIFDLVDTPGTSSVRTRFAGDHITPPVPRLISAFQFRASLPGRETAKRTDPSKPRGTAPSDRSHQDQIGNLIRQLNAQ